MYSVMNEPSALDIVERVWAGSTAWGVGDYKKEQQEKGEVNTETTNYYATQRYGSIEVTCRKRSNKRDGEIQGTIMLRCCCQPGCAMSRGPARFHDYDWKQWDVNHAIRATSYFLQFLVAHVRSGFQF